MTSLRYTANAILELTPERVVATGGPGSTQEPLEIADRALLTVLEMFVHSTDPMQVCTELERLAPAHEASRDAIPADVAAARALEVHLGPERFLVSSGGGNEWRNLTGVSRESKRTLAVLMAALGHRPSNGDSSLTRERFEQTFSRLVELGLLVPSPGSVEWGSLRRTRPLCVSFGFFRGTPIDRYYLLRFVDHIRERVTGRTIEIGGTAGDPRRHGFRGVTEYTNVDMEARRGVDVVGDVHDPDLLPPDSADAVVAFNVLEHCTEPWVVVENIRRWLRPGGQAFCMVPHAQRIHESPQDYWRPSPGGLSWMFRSYARQERHQYGNPASLIASYLGIAAQELDRDELDVVHPDYPVISCVIACK